MKVICFLLIICPLRFFFFSGDLKVDKTLTDKANWGSVELINYQTIEKKSKLSWTVEFLSASVYDSTRTHLSPKFSLRNQSQSIMQIESIDYCIVSDRDGSSIGKLMVEYTKEKIFHSQPLKPDSAMSYIGRQNLSIDKLFLNKSFTDPFNLYFITRLIYRESPGTKNLESYLIRRIDPYPLAKRPRVYPFVWHLQFDLLPVAKQELAKLKEVLSTTGFDYKKLLSTTL